MFFARWFCTLLSAVTIVLALAACQPVPPAAPPSVGEQFAPVRQASSMESPLVRDISQTNQEKLEHIAQRFHEARQIDPDFDRLIALYPDRANSYFARGLAYAGAGYPDQAIQDFDKTLQLDPSHAEAYFNRGVAYADLGNSDQAVHDLEASLLIDPNASYASQLRAMLADLHAQQE